ncbi:extracellular solute-binding protein [Nonomuraea sp. NPDC059194]|uniref:ABC transporter substrate-binding protein n=1 Tax=Nonomuraea sp. NPDC059194 TaxID=3346764 RepID=UPI0036BB2244
MRAPQGTARFLAAAVVATLALTACGGSGDQGSAEEKGGQFTYWSMWKENEPQAKVIKAAIDKFQAETGTKVTVEWQGRDIRTKIGPAIAANKAPDLVENGFDVISSLLVSTGQAADLTPVYDSEVPGEGKKVSEVIPAKYVDAMPKDPEGVTRWIVPYVLNSATYHYNKADADLATTPATWDEFVKLCDTLKAEDKACVASDGDNTWTNFLLLDYLLVRDNGAGTMGKIFNDKSGAAWDQPGVLESAKRVEQFVKAGYILQGYDASKYPAQQTNWATGKAAFHLDGTWVPSEAQKNLAGGFKVGQFAVPATKGGNTEIDIIPLGFAIPKKAKNPGPAQKFIAYFLKKDNISGISTEAKNITPRADVPAPEELLDAQKLLNDSPSRLPIDGVSGDYLDKAIFPAFSELWLGKATAEQFIAKAKEGHLAYWKANG